MNGKVEIIYDYIITETKYAFHISIDEKTYWFGKNAPIEVDEQNKTITMPMWLCKKESLEDYIND